MYRPIKHKPRIMGWDDMIMAVAPSVIGGLFGKAGQDSANEQNKDIMNQNSAFNAEQAQLNRDFQRDMSNTAYTRATADMTNAGLNPMLAYSQGGASTPGGSQASAATNATMQNSALAGLQAAQGIANVTKTKAETENVEADTEVKREQPAQIRNQTKKIGYEIGNIIADTKNKNLTYDEIEQRIDNLVAQYDLSRAQASKVREEIPKIIAERHNISAHEAKTRVETLLLDLEIPGVANEAAFQKHIGETGKWLEHGAKALGDVSRARSLFRFK